MTELVRLDVEDGIATIRLDRPPMNALNGEIQEGLVAAARAVTVDDEVFAVIVHGGEKVFAAGADIKEMAAMDHADMARRSGLLQEFTRALAGIPKPTMSAITGYALGGGCEVALATDFRIAGESARLGQPEISLGIIPGAGGTQRLARLVGPARAKDLIFSGRMISAQEALDIGLVDAVVPDAEVYAQARERMSRYVGGPALALKAAKEAIDQGLEVDLQTGLEIERMAFSALFATQDRTIGMGAFVAKEKPAFTGR